MARTRQRPPYKSFLSRSHAPICSPATSQGHYGSCIIEATNHRGQLRYFDRLFFVDFFLQSVLGLISDFLIVMISGILGRFGGSEVCA
jgi:hypothetical protein